MGNWWKLAISSDLCESFISRPRMCVDLLFYCVAYFPPATQGWECAPLGLSRVGPQLHLSPSSQWLHLAIAQVFKVLFCHLYLWCSLGLLPWENLHFGQHECGQQAAMGTRSHGNCRKASQASYPVLQLYLQLGHCSMVAWLLVRARSPVSG